MAAVSPVTQKTARLPLLKDISPSCHELGLPPLTYRNRMLPLCSVSVGFVVDIAGISGKLLLSPAPGLASRTGRLVRFGLRHGEGARIQPPSWLGVAPKGAAALIRLDGGWAWKGPGHPVDNGGQARCQRDGLRSEGAARVLFLWRRPLPLAPSACSSPPGAAAARSVEPGRGTNLRAGSLSAEDKQRNALMTGTATPGRARRDIMACTVRDESCPDQYRLFTQTQR